MAPAHRRTLWLTLGLQAGVVAGQVALLETGEDLFRPLAWAALLLNAFTAGFVFLRLWDGR